MCVYVCVCVSECVCVNVCGGKGGGREGGREGRGREGEDKSCMYVTCVVNWQLQNKTKRPKQVFVFVFVSLHVIG